MLRRFQAAVKWATPGQVDAGLSSLATFAAGLVAVRELPAPALAAYALLFGAYQIVNQISREAVFMPSQILSVRIPATERLGLLRHSLPTGSLVALFAATLVPLGALPVFSELPPETLIALSSTAFVLAVVSPIQNHVRAMLYLSGAPWTAASVSAVHFGATVATLVGLPRPTIEWVPFGAQFVGNIVSLLFAVWWFRRRSPAHVERPSGGDLRSLGKWLLVTGVGTAALSYSGSVILKYLAGTTALALVEAARTASRPVSVLLIGLMSLVGPRSMEAGAQRDLTVARRWRKRFMLMGSVAAGAYALLTAFPWALNPMYAVIPRAYTVPFLIVAMIGGELALSLWRPGRNELFGAGEPRVVAKITLRGGLLEVGAAAATATITGPFAIPIGMATGGGFLLAASRLRLRRVYPRTPVSSSDG